MKKILIVEDELIPAKLLKTILTRSNFEVVNISKNAEDAINSAKEKNPELILMDIRLQGDMDGIEAMHIIRQFSDVPVIYLTGNSDFQTKKRADETNSSGYFTKPYDNNELLKAVKEILK